MFNGQYRLSSDVWLQVFLLCDVIDVFSGIVRTCKRWHHIVNSLLFSLLYIKQCLPQADSTILHALIHEYQFSRDLQKSFYCPTWKLLLLWSKQNKDTRTLILWLWQKFTFNDLIKVRIQKQSSRWKHTLDIAQILEPVSALLCKMYFIKRIT